MTEEQIADSGQTLKSKAGPPVLILLDASSAISHLKFDKTKSEDVKLWVLNRIPIYYSDDGSTWHRGYGNFEGCLTKPQIIVIKKKETREYIPLKQGQIRIHFTAVIPKDADRDKRCDSYCNSKMKMEGPTKEYMRPYIEGYKDDQEKFNFGLFNKGIQVLKIPSDKVKYPFDIGQLEYWERQIYRMSLDKKVAYYRQLELDGTLTTTMLNDELKPLLKKKLGSWRANLESHSGSTEPPRPILWNPKAWVLEEDMHCFIFGQSRDVLESREEEADQKVSGRISLYKLDKPQPGFDPSYTLPMNQALENFHFSDFYKKFFKRIVGGLTELGTFEYHRTRTESFLDEEPGNENDLAKRLMDDIKNIVQYPILRNAFQIGIASHKDTCIMLALNNAVANAESFIEQENIDRQTLGKGTDQYHISIKRVFFATGSDSFSDDVVPKHVYFQLESWWNGLHTFQQEEIKDSEEIKVIGFSSRFTTETTEDDNVRLRKDRAWKTAVCLQHLFKKLQIKSSGPLFEDQSEDAIKVIHEGAAEGTYPEPAVFNKFERTFVQDVIDPGKVNVIESRDTKDNNPEDRVCWLVFKKPKKEYEQVVKNTIVTNNALPIYKYRTVLYLAKKIDQKKKIDRKNDLVLLYVCPGRFIS
jgi:hypothetical protein